MFGTIVINKQKEAWHDKKRRRGVDCWGVERFFCLDFLQLFEIQIFTLFFLLNYIRTNIIIVLKFKQHILKNNKSYSSKYRSFKQIVQ